MWDMLGSVVSGAWSVGLLPVVLGSIGAFSCVRFARFWGTGR